MQENPSPDTPPIASKGLSLVSIICLVLTFLMMMSLAIIFTSHITERLETRDGRMAGIQAPYQCEGFKIASIESSWNSSEGNERLSLRTLFYPSVTIKLEDVEGSGVLLLSYANGANKAVGNMVALRFSKEGFAPTSDPTAKVDGMSATFLLEGGYNSKDDYYLHCIDETQPLWRVNISYKMDADNRRLDVGYTSISVE